MAAKNGPTGNWFKQSKSIHGILLDISGVLLNGTTPIPGSVDGVKRLKDAGVPVKFVTNETTLSPDLTLAKLQKLGFPAKEGDVFAPAPAVKQILQERGLRPHLLVHPVLESYFDDVDKSDPNCVVMGDAVEAFSYTNMNQAFRILISLENPALIAMGRGKYYKEEDGLKLDVGPFMRALEYACDVEAEVIGKPSEAYFQAAVKELNLQSQNVLMIGDDIVNDIGGAQKCGLLGVQVRTGKYRSADEPHASVTPDGYVDNLAQAVDLFLKYRNM